MVTRLLPWFNRLIAVGYIVVGARAVWTLIQGDHSRVFAVALVLVALPLAYGHLQMRSLAIKLSAALAGVATFFLGFGLLPSYEPELSPPMSTRVMNFSIFVMITGVLCANYYLSRRLPPITSRKADRV